MPPNQISSSPPATLNVRFGRDSIEDLQNFQALAQRQAAAAGGGEISARANEDGSYTLYLSDTENGGAHAPAARASSAGERANKQHLAHQLIRDIIGRRLPPESEAARVILAHIDTRRTTADLADALAMQQALARTTNAELAQSGVPSPFGDPEKTVQHFARQGQGWDEIKRTFINLEADPSSAKMKVLQAHRQQVVDSLLHTVIARLREGHVHFTSAGSNNPTSDYDVQLYDDGSLEGNPGRVIAEFNRVFRERYGLESGTLFDTNLYDPSFRLPREIATEDRYITASEARTDVANDRAQIEGSLAKIRKFAEEPVWTRLLSGIEQQCHTNDQRDRIKDHFNEAAKLIDTMQNEIALEVTRISDMPTEDDRLQATNLLYTRALEEVQSAREAQQAISAELRGALTPEARNEREGALDEATLRRKAAMVNATLFAHEAYHSEGPMISVVGIGQGVIARSFEYQRPVREDNRPASWGDREARPNPELRRPHNLESFNENFGDALKDIGHYRGDGGARAFGETMVQVSKYLGRCFDSAVAAGVTLSPSLVVIRENLGALKELRAQANSELGDLRGRFAAVDINNVDDLVNALTQLAVSTNAAVLAPANAQQNP